MTDTDLVSEAPARRLSSSYSAIHLYLQRHFAKTGVCVQCERQPAGYRTEFALITGREYSRNREDYLELCVPCHRRMDGNLPPVEVKLSGAIVVEARLLYFTGQAKGRELARRHGVNHRAMQRAINGDTWKHVSADDLLVRADSIFAAVDRVTRKAA